MQDKLRLFFGRSASILALLWFGGQSLHAKLGDFIIQPLDGTSVTTDQIQIRLAAFLQGQAGLTITPVTRVDMPHIDFNVVVANFSPPGPAAAFRAANPDLIVEEDRQELTPAGANPSSWPLNPDITGSMFPNSTPYPTMAVTPSMVSRPEVYIVDTGIQTTIGTDPHPCFDPSRVDFGPGIVANSLQPLNLSPYQDLGGTHGHGTAVASAVAGVYDTAPIGSLMKWPGTKCTIISALMYPPPSPTGPSAAWTSDAVTAIAQCVNSHMRTWRDGIVGNEGGVLVFAHRLTNHYSPSLEIALWNAWNKGCMTVVCSAGNNYLTNIPRKPTVAMPVSDVSSTSMGTSSPGRIPVSWAGFTTSNLWARQTSSTGFVAGNEHWIIAGGSNQSGTRWNAGSGVGSNNGNGIDVWAPADCILLASSSTTSLVGRSGTSFAAGYTAGLAAYYLAHRPFATGPAVKKWMQTLANGNVTTGIATTPGSALRPRLSVTTEASPSIASQYAEWRADCSLGTSGTTNLQTDNDTVSNGIEFALGTHPRISDTDAHSPLVYFNTGTMMMDTLPAPTLPPTNFWVTAGTIQTHKSYLMNWPLAGVTCHWEFSPDLVSWTPAPLTAFSAPVRGQGTMFQGSTPPMWTAGFFRVRVTPD